MVAFSRTAIPDFQTANALYAGANVTAYTVDANGAATTTLATLYAAITGTDTLANPVRLDSQGKWLQQPYIDTAVILQISRAGIVDHTTGVIGANLAGDSAADAKTSADQARGTLARINQIFRGLPPVPFGLVYGGTGATSAGGALTNFGFSTFFKTLIGAASAAALRGLIDVTQAINSLTTENTVDGANDLIAFRDAGAGADRKTSVNNLIDTRGIIQGSHTIWIPAAAMVSRTTNGASSGTTELATNDVMLSTLDFDASTEEGAQIMIGMPKSWNEGTITATAYWTAASSSGAVVWEFAAVAIGDDDALDAAVGTAVTVTDTLLAVNDAHIAPTSAAITPAGTPADNDILVFEVTRKAADGGDTLAADAKLIGVRLTYTVNAKDDS